MASGQAYKFQGSEIQVLVGYTGSSPSPAITAVTAANPPVVTSTSHGLADGDVVRISGVGGMTDLNGNTYIVDVLSANTFSLLDIVGAGYNAYTSGGVFDKATFTNFCDLTDYNRSGGTKPEILRTTICSTRQEYFLGLGDEGTTALTYHWAPNTSAVQLAIEAFDRSGLIMAIKVVLPDGGGTRTQLGYVQQTSETGAVNGIWNGTATLKNTGPHVDFP